METYMTLPADPKKGRYLVLKDEDGDLHWVKEGDGGRIIEFPPMDDPWYKENK